LVATPYFVPDDLVPEALRIKLLDILAPGLFSTQVFLREFPVDQVLQVRFDVIVPAVLVIQIVGVFPDVDG